MIAFKNKHIHSACSLCCGAAAALALAACSDFSDYNEVVADAKPSANQTLWENIQQNVQLSDFAALVKRSGFDQELSASHYYTVWAPLNGTYSTADYQALSNSALLRQFVQNHIASYAHSASGQVDEHVMMLNEKSYLFEGASTYTFDDVELKDANLPSSNGVLHTLNGVANFYPSLYEYVTDSTLAVGKEIDSLRNYFLRYELTYLDTEASVPGSIVNGLQTYVDSVMVTENSLWTMLRARIQNEDSTYMFLMPTNKAWAATYNRIKDCYRYLPTTVAQAFVTTGGTTSIASTNASITIDPSYWQDSIACRNLTKNLIYSNNDNYNLWLSGKTSPYGTDTLRSTTNNKLSNTQAILAQTVEERKMSNGTARLVDSLAFYPWETYAPERSISAARSQNRARVLTGNVQSFNVTFRDQDQEDIQYVWIEPNGGYAKPELDLYLTNVLSSTYDLYCVFMPPYDQTGTTPEEWLPNRVIFTLNYCDENGTLKEYTFLDESEENVTSFQERFNLPDNASNATTIRAFSNDVTKIDTLYLGEFTFPACYYGLGDEICPNIKISSPFSVFNKDLMEAYCRDLRIAAIILKPKELVEFEESNKK